MTPASGSAGTEPLVRARVGQRDETWRPAPRADDEGADADADEDPGLDRFGSSRHVPKYVPDLDTLRGATPPPPEEDGGEHGAGATPAGRRPAGAPARMPRPGPPGRPAEDEVIDLTDHGPDVPASPPAGPGGLPRPPGAGAAGSGRVSPAASGAPRPSLFSAPRPTRAPAPEPTPARTAVADGPEASVARAEPTYDAPGSGAAGATVSPRPGGQSVIDLTGRAAPAEPSPRAEPAAPPGRVEPAVDDALLSSKEVAGRSAAALAAEAAQSVAATLGAEAPRPPVDVSMPETPAIGRVEFEPEDDQVDQILHALVRRAHERRVAIADVAVELVEQAELEDRDIDEVLADLVEHTAGGERSEELVLYNDDVPNRPGRLVNLDALGPEEKKRIIVRVLCLLVALQESNAEAAAAAAAGATAAAPDAGEAGAGGVAPAPASGDAPDGPSTGLAWPVPLDESGPASGDGRDDLPGRGLLRGWHT